MCNTVFFSVELLLQFGCQRVTHIMLNRWAGLSVLISESNITIYLISRIKLILSLSNLFNFTCCFASLQWLYFKSSVFICFQANDGNWPLLKQSSAPVVKPPQISNTDWKESSMDTALKQGTISSQPLPTSALGSTDKLVRFLCGVFIDLFC